MRRRRISVNRGGRFANVSLIHFDGEAANAFPTPLAIAAHPRRARAGSILTGVGAPHGASVTPFRISVNC